MPHFDSKHLITNGILIASLGLNTFSPVLAATPYWDDSSSSGSSVPTQQNNGSFYTPPTNTAPNYNTNPYQNNAIPTLKASITTIPSGTTMLTSVNTSASSASSQIGDPVSVTLSNDVIVNGMSVLPAGTIVQGSVVKVLAGRRLNRYGQLQLRFTRAETPDGHVYPLSAKIVTDDNTGIIKAGTGGDTAKKALGNTAVGSLVGAGTGLLSSLIFGGRHSLGTGMLRGAAYGGAIGLGKTAFDRGDDVEIGPGVNIQIQLDQPVTVNPSAPVNQQYSPQYNNYSYPNNGSF